MPKMMSKRPSSPKSSFSRRLTELYRLDSRQRKYLFAQLVLRVAPVLPGPIVKKMQRRIVKYSLYPLAGQKGLRKPQRSPRICRIEADLRRAAARAAR